MPQPVRNSKCTALGAILLTLVCATSLAAQPAAADEKKTEAPAEPEKKPEPPPPEEFQVKGYGWILANYIHSNHAMLSVGRENLQATQQAKRRTQADDAVSQSGIFVNQSQLGLKASLGTTLQAGIEMDFVDLSKGSPYTNANPRLRQAYVDFMPAEGWVIFAGLKPDLFSPLAPDFYNPVGALRGSGNAGFMREQLGLGRKLGAWTISAAAGNTTANTTASPVISAEQNRAPTGALQIKFSPFKELTLFLSGITANVAYRAPLIEPATRAGTPLEYNGASTSLPASKKLGGDGVTRRASSGAALGGDVKIMDNLTLKIEGNWGRNLGNINTFAISSVQRRTTLPELDNGILSKVSTTSPQSDAVNYLRTLKNYHSIAQYDSTEEAGGWFSLVYSFAPFEAGAFAGVTKIVRWQNRLTAPSTTTDLSLSQADPATGIWTSASLGSVRESRTAGLTFAFLMGKGAKAFLSVENYETLYFVPDRERGVLGALRSINLDTGALTLASPANPFAVASPRARSNVVRAGMSVKF